jgi:hypothetical protein
MTRRAKGTFEVKRSAEPALDMGDGKEAGHFRFDKTFEGPLTATSVVHMMAAMTDTPGSGAYVAIERLRGTLEGRSGTCLFAHYGVMEKGTPSLQLAVVPDSGSDGFVGLRGKLANDKVDGPHKKPIEKQKPHA